MKFDIEAFTKMYKGTKWFTEEKHFSDFLMDIKNEELIKNLIFCNDYLSAPPILAYIKYRSDIYTKELEKKEKLALGACFGYLFKVMLGYKDAKTVWIGDKTTNIKNASYFVK